MNLCKNMFNMYDAYTKHVYTNASHCNEWLSKDYDIRRIFNA